MLTDDELHGKIEYLQNKVYIWALKHQLCNDCKFVDYMQLWEDDEPALDNPCITILLPGDDLLRTMRGSYSQTTDELDKIMEDNLFSVDFDGDCLYFYCIDEKVIISFSNYFEWKWITNLVKPDILELHDDLYSYFHNHPEKFHSLSARKFEILMSELLKHQGYETLLGPGTRDGGVDIRLLKKEGIDTQVTLVQVKRYDMKYAIELKAVSALFGTVHDERIHTQDKNIKGLFITSSRYLPSAREFASRNNNILNLIDRDQIREWSFDASSEIRKDKSKIFNKTYILGLLDITIRDIESNVGSILYSNYCSPFNDTESSEFYIVIKDSKHVSLIMRLPKKNIYMTPNYNSGTEGPILDRSILQFLNNDNIFRVRKYIDEKGKTSFRGQRKTYFIWNGKSTFFLGD